MYRRYLMVRYIVIEDMLNVLKSVVWKEWFRSRCLTRCATFTVKQIQDVRYQNQTQRMPFPWKGFQKSNRKSHPFHSSEGGIRYHFADTSWSLPASWIACLPHWIWFREGCCNWTSPGNFHHRPVWQSHRQAYWEDSSTCLSQLSTRHSSDRNFSKVTCINLRWRQTLPRILTSDKLTRQSFREASAGSM